MKPEPFDGKRLEDSVEKLSERIDKARRERPTLLAQAAVLGTLGLLFVLPVIAGAYLGVWLDGQIKTYSVSWTVSLIFVGVVIGAINVWLFIRD